MSVKFCECVNLQKHKIVLIDDGSCVHKMSDVPSVDIAMFFLATI